MSWSTHKVIRCIVRINDIVCTCIPCCYIKLSTFFKGFFMLFSLLKLYSVYIHICKSLTLFRNIHYGSWENWKHKWKFNMYLNKYLIYNRNFTTWRSSHLQAYSEPITANDYMVINWCTHFDELIFEDDINDEKIRDVWLCTGTSCHF